MRYPSPQAFILCVINNQSNYTILVMLKCTIKLLLTIVTLLCYQILGLIHSFNFSVPSPSFIFFETEFYSCSVQARVWWCDHSLLQPQTPRLKPSSHLRFPSRWEHRYAPPHPANFFCFVGSFSLCWPGLSSTPDLRCSSHLGFPKC